MATAPVKSPLHNFPLTFLKWGSKNNHPRCRRSPFDSPDPPSGSRPSRRPSSDDDKDAAAAAAVEVDAEGEPDSEADHKPWNLRPRKPTTAPSHPPPPSSSSSAQVRPPQLDENLPKSIRLRGFDSQASGSAAAGGVRGEKRKFWIALSREEIEEDIYSLIGSKPSRRPRKRPKNVQKQLDNLFPGLWLVGLTPEAYRGLDNPPKR